ncbi:gamma-aminobutyric acid type B receptor subunit 1-like [Mercenaria mercenaria]|uniref:gamma-aminobutyric acid type B receptor subunit 1-like n=1 Tax=Mercenaria mercenaria TaxID=6596 RepID=UPI00234EE96D|nr:gamma-aminobutyric acid type B receptor subunit 1-like [Mercenaria mercenaria]
MIKTLTVENKVIFHFFLVSFYVISSGNGRELRFLMMLPRTGSGWIGSDACEVAVNMALDDINANENILKDYNLTYRWFDSKENVRKKNRIFNVILVVIQCDPGTSVYRMFEMFHADPPYHMLLGGGCSITSEATSQVSYMWNITQFSYGSSSPILSDRKRFPRFFRIALPDQKLNPARIDLMRTFNWKKVATINQALEFFSVVIDDFVQRVRGTEITIISQEIFVNDPLTRVQNLKTHDARIIMTAMYEHKARDVLCAAYKVGLYGPKIVWVFVGWFSSYFWRVHLDNVACTEYEMDLAAEGAFITGPVYQNPTEERGIANLTAKEFDYLYHHHETYTPEMKQNDFVAHQCYDNIWVSAMALNCTVQRLEEIGHPKTLDMFTYTDTDINDIIFECMGNTSMTGVSGKIVFTAGADPNRIVKMERIQGGKRELIGHYRQDKYPNGYFEWIEDAIKWKDGNIPRDSTYVTQKEVKIPLSLYVPVAVLSGVGICLAISFFTFNVIYRQNRNVKLSSPNINSVILLGCVLCYSSVFFKTTEVENATICWVRTQKFFFGLGFTVTFGGLFSKTWRVYRIFTNKKLLKRTIKDYQLLAIIGGLVGVVAVMMVLWAIISPYSVVVNYLDKQVTVFANDAEVHLFVRVCHSEYSTYFGWALYIIQGALLSFGAFLAWETRHVKIQALNDSHQIGLCLYNVVILSAVGLTLSLLLVDQEVMMYGITSGCLIIGTTLTQAVIFIPKIHAVYNKVDTNMTTFENGTGGQSANNESLPRTGNTADTA